VTKLAASWNSANNFFFYCKFQNFSTAVDPEEYFTVTLIRVI
jgi:hypothetical protein